MRLLLASQTTMSVGTLRYATSDEVIYGEAELKEEENNNNGQSDAQDS